MAKAVRAETSRRWGPRRSVIGAKDSDDEEERAAPAPNPKAPPPEPPAPAQAALPTITMADFGVGHVAAWALTSLNRYTLYEPRGVALPELAHLPADAQFVLKEWRAFVHNGVATMACLQDEEDVAELNELKASDWEERVHLLYKYRSYLGGPKIPLGPKVLFGLGTFVHPGGPACHPRAPPVLFPDRARMVIVGDSTLWGVSSSVNKQGQHERSRRRPLGSGHLCHQRLARVIPWWLRCGTGLP